MKINTKKLLVDFRGKEIFNELNQPTTIGEVLSQTLGFERKGGNMKTYLIGRKCSEQDEVEIDSADMALIKPILQKSETYPNVVLGQILLYLEELK